MNILSAGCLVLVSTILAWINNYAYIYGTSSVQMLLRFYIISATVLLYIMMRPSHSRWQMWWQETSVDDIAYKIYNGRWNVHFYWLTTWQYSDNKYGRSRSRNIYELARMIRNTKYIVPLQCCNLAQNNCPIMCVNSTTVTSNSSFRF